MKIAKDISIAVLLLLITGCKKDDWFDVKTDSNLAIPSSLKDLQALLDNANLFNAWCPSMQENAADYHSYRVSAYNRMRGFERNAFTWTKNEPNVSVLDWINGSNSGSYGKIYTANLILESLEKIEAPDNNSREQADNIKGQALFFRAKTFYELSVLFVPPYDESIFGQKYGLPLRLESDINVKSVRSTIGETFQQILKDLTESVNLLPMNQQFKTRPSKIAAYALLARIYLSWGNYTEAERYADLSLKSYNKLIDYNSLSYETTANPFVGYNDETIFYSYMGGVTFILPTISIVNEFYESFDENDIRKRAFFNFSASTGRVTYKGTYAGVGFSYFFNGLATDELFLIRAECRARAGKTADAMIDLNTLLRNRFKPPFTDIAVANAEEALIVILAERKKELVMRGVRWSDLRRLNKEPRFAQTLTRVVDTQTFTLEPNSYKYTFPLPDDIIQLTGMEQNPGW